MSSYVYPNNISGLSFDVIRSPDWNTGVQKAMTGKRSTIAYQPWPLIHFELAYELLRDDLTTSDLKALVGLFNAVQGQYDTFLFIDPDFNYVQQQLFGTGNASTTAFQLVATYGNSGGPSYAEIIQNLYGTTSIYENRWGGPELLSTGSRTNLALQSTLGASPWTSENTTSTPSAATSPDGATHATKIIDTATTAVHTLQQGSLSVTASDAYTYSVWLKYVNYQYAAILLDNGANSGVSVNVDLVNGLISSVSYNTAGGTWTSGSATITAFSNGWYRVTLTGTPPSTWSTARINVQFSTGMSGNAWGESYLGNGTNAFLAWGAQLELGSNATALIVTTSSSANNGGSDYSLGATGIVTTVSAPATGVELLWTGNFYYRCAFDEDTFDWTKFLNQWWNAKVKFTSVVL